LLFRQLREAGIARGNEISTLEAALRAFNDGCLLAGKLAGAYYGPDGIPASWQVMGAM